MSRLVVEKMKISNPVKSDMIENTQVVEVEAVVEEEM